MPAVRKNLQLIALDAFHQEIRNGSYHKPVAQLLAARPKNQWQEWAIKLLSQAIETDKSIVDIIERTIGTFGSDAFKVWHAETFGVWTRTCNCEALRKQWMIEYTLT